MAEEYEIDYSYNALVCSCCGRVEKLPFDIGDECYEDCGTFHNPVPFGNLKTYERLGLMTNKISKELFKDEGAVGGEIVSAVQMLCETNRMMKYRLQDIIDCGCSCSSLQDQASICKACLASETLDLVHEKHRAMFNAVTANIEHRRSKI